MRGKTSKTAALPGSCGIESHSVDVAKNVAILPAKNISWRPCIVRTLVQ